MTAEENTASDHNSEHIHEYLSELPRWMVRSGSLVLLIIIGALLLLLSVIKYPEVIRCTIKITSTYPPARLIARSSGRVVYFPIRDNFLADSGQALAILESDARPDDIAAMQARLEAFDSSADYTKVLLDGMPRLGMCQQPYEEFTRAVNEYKLFNLLHPQTQEIARIDRSVHEGQSLVGLHLKQDSIQKNEIELARKGFERIRLLREQNVISSQEFEDKQNELLAKVRGYESSRENLLRTRMNIESLLKERKQLEMTGDMDGKRKLLDLLNAKNTLENAIRQWEQLYVVRAPFRGLVVLDQVWTINQYMHSGDQLCSLISEDQGFMFGRLAMPSLNSGKVMNGQAVNIALDAFPYQEFGYLKGVVQHVSLVPENGQYIVIISLPDQMRTSFAKVLPSKSEMEGNAEIITERRTMLQRVLSFLKSTKK